MGSTQTAPIRDSALRRDFIITRAVRDARSWLSPVVAETGDNAEFSWERNRQLLKNIFIVWLDSYVNQNSDIQTAIKRLKKSSNHVLSMDNYRQCVEWLTEYKDNKKIILIVSNEFDKKIVLDVHHLSSIIAIYMYSLHSKTDNHCARNYEKVCDLVLSLDELLEIISRDLVRFQHDDDSNIKLRPCIPAISIPMTPQIKEKLNENEAIDSGSYEYLE